MDVSIIIINFKTSELTRQAIRSVIQYTRDVQYEIIVVDNNSQDSSIEDIKHEFGESVILLELPENIGFGKANNAGFKIAKGRFLFCLNSDTILMNNAVWILSSYLDNNKDVGIVGGNLFSKEEQPNQSFSYPLSISKELYNLTGKLLFKRFKIEFNHTDNPIEVGYICGADMMIPSEIVKKVGMFDPDFFMYYEETELTHRVRQAGYKIICIPESKIIHLEGASFKHSKTKLAMIYKSRHLFLRKVYSRPYVFVVNLILLTNIVLKLILFSLLCNKVKMAQWYHTLISLLRNW